MRPCLPSLQARTVASMHVAHVWSMSLREVDQLPVVTGVTHMDLSVLLIPCLVALDAPGPLSQAYYTGGGIRTLADFVSARRPTFA
jgi:hypothetical protein